MFATLVLALDGSDASDMALECAARLAKEQGSAVRVVHVVELAVGRGGGTLHLDESGIRAKIEGQVERLCSDGVNAKLEVHPAIAGGPAHVIADVAVRVDADMIVTGTRGKTALAGFFLGSVANRLLHLAHCPVLVVPDAARLQAIRRTAAVAAESHEPARRAVLASGLASARVAAD
jgi:nucleotide-binding universal stress UspA family protein